MENANLFKTITIRPATPEDARALAIFAQTVFAETFSYRCYPAEDLAAFYKDYMSQDKFAAQISNADYQILLATGAGHRIVGFAKTGPVGLPLPPSETGIAGLELHQLYLASDIHGSGLANAMMDRIWAQAKAANASAVYLSVYSENIRAQRFYARHGFAEIGKNPFAVGRVIDDDRIWKADVARPDTGAVR